MQKYAYRPLSTFTFVAGIFARHQSNQVVQDIGLVAMFVALGILTDGAADRITDAEQEAPRG